MGISSSVISEYENNRTRTPGTKYLRKFVESLIEIDLRRGGKVVSLLSSSHPSYTDKRAILLIRDFYTPFPSIKLIEAVDGEVISGNEYVSDSKLYGYTVVDSLAAILSLSGTAFYRIFGRSTERALIFTNVSTGRSPMVAIRVYPLKPRMVVVHKPTKVDKLSIEIAKKERIIYVKSRIDDVNILMKNLDELTKRISELVV